MPHALHHTHTPPSKILGLNVAVDDLVMAWFRHAQQTHFPVLPTDATSRAHIEHLAQAANLAPERLDLLNPHEPPAHLATLFRPDPALANLAWQRAQLPHRGHALTGLVHSLSGEHVTQAVTDLCLAPTDSSDALICPSRAIRDAVRNLWEIQTDYLNHRCGSAFKCPVQTPIIPLGIDTEKFKALSAPALRGPQRAALHVADDEVLILFTGRLSFATKAHPLPLLQAVERAAQRCAPQKLRLILHGYFTPREVMEPRFRALIDDLCQTARCEIVLNEDLRFPHGLWAAADIFTSLVDNVQESFGLTPVEAMACGLPCVVSDWDGYRDSVEDHLSGFRIPTAAPPPLAGQSIAAQAFNKPNYGSMLVATAQSTALDSEAASEAFARLATDANLRHTLGANARARAQKTYDWRVIIPAYEELWREQTNRRRVEKPPRATPQDWPAAHPHHPNPYKVFASFPTRALAPEDHLSVAQTPDAIATLLSHDMNYFIPEQLLPLPALHALIETIRNAKSLPIKALLTTTPPDNHPQLWRSVGWLLKHGLCILATDPAPQPLIKPLPNC